MHGEQRPAVRPLPAGQSGTGGHRSPGPRRPAPVTPPGPTAALAIRCLGEFTVEVNGSAVDLAAVRPRARSLLKMLCLHADQPVTEERLLHAMGWPQAPRARHNLQVAISAVRMALAPGRRRGDPSVVHRRGGGYELMLPPGSFLDVAVLEAAGRSLVRASERDVGRLRAAVDLYRGDLFPEEGDAEWVVDDRDRFRDIAARAAAAVARAALLAGDAAVALAYAERGVSIDRLNDDVWQVLIQAHRALGNRVAAQRAGILYRNVLRQLGVPLRGVPPALPAQAHPLPPRTTDEDPR